MSLTPRIGLLGLTLLLTTSAIAQLRVAEWNVTNFGSTSNPQNDDSRVDDFQTAIYASFGGRSMSPDILVTQEIINVTGANKFLNMLNSAPGSPGDWAYALWKNASNQFVFFNSSVGDTESCLYYRTSRVVWKDTIVVYDPPASSSSDQPRATMKYLVRPAGTPDTPANTLAIYSTHMKAGNTSTDQARRLVEADRIKADAQIAVAAGYNVLFAADTNIQSSEQSAYESLVGPNSYAPTGPFYDPIIKPGSWYQNTSFRNIHTQEPSSQMDDRHDQILVGAALRNNSGLDYIGSTTTAFKAYNTSDPEPWNDPNHSYRCWGNDGGSYFTALRTSGNTQVGPTIAQALINTVQSNGHLPVYLDLRVPAEAAVNTTFLDFGILDQGDSVSLPFQVTNSGDVAKWTVAGVANLNYTISSGAGIVSIPGSFILSPSADRSHNATLITTTPGIKTGTITINTDGANTPILTVNWQAIIVAKTNFPHNPRLPGGNKRRR